MSICSTVNDGVNGNTTDGHEIDTDGSGGGGSNVFPFVIGSDEF